MSPADGHRLDDLSLLLGAIKNQIETVSKTLSEDRLSAAQYRTDIRKELQTVREQVDTVTPLVTRMEPIVENLRDHYLMAIGVGKFARWLAHVGYAIAGAVGAFMLTLLHKYWS